MDEFKANMLKDIGIGGLKCSCCNNLAKKGHGKKDKTLHKRARKRIKEKTLKALDNN